MSTKITLQNAFESWWFDPLTATIGFTVAVYVYSYYEIQTGSSVYKSFYRFLDMRGDPGKVERHSQLKSLVAYWIGVVLWIQVSNGVNRKTESLILI